MAAYNKFEQFVEDLADKKHDCSSDQFDVALCAAASAPVATNEILANLTEISYTNLSARSLTTSSAAQSSGTYTLLFADLVLTASGTVAGFRYVVIFNQTQSSPADPLVSYYDYGSDLVLENTETFKIDFTSSTFQLT